jgi:hypothetical protein
MKDVRYVIDWLEEELAHFEMAVEQHNYVTKADEIRYRMAQELLAWILESKFDPRFSASPVSHVPCQLEQDTKSFGSRT